MMVPAGFAPNQRMAITSPASRFGDRETPSYVWDQVEVGSPWTIPACFNQASDPIHETFMMRHGFAKRGDMKARSRSTARRSADAGATTPALAISAEKVAYIITKAREFDVKDVVTDPDSGSNASDDAML